MDRLRTDLPVGHVIREAKSALRKAVLEAQSDDFHIENPVTRSRAMIRIKEREAKQRDELMELAICLSRSDLLRLVFRVLGLLLEKLFLRSLQRDQLDR